MARPANNIDGLKRLLHTWCEERPVRLCVLFGSQATGQTHSGSDIDLALWPSKTPTSADKLRWVRELADLTDHEVSLVLISPELDPVLGFEIVRDGVLAIEREAELWLVERSRLWHAYNDSLPFRRTARRLLKEFAQAVSTTAPVDED